MRVLQSALSLHVSPSASGQVLSVHNSELVRREYTPYSPSDVSHGGLSPLDFGSVIPQGSLSDSALPSGGSISLVAAFVASVQPQVDSQSDTHTPLRVTDSQPRLRDSTGKSRDGDLSNG